MRVISQGFTYTYNSSKVEIESAMIKARSLSLVDEYLDLEELLEYKRALLAKRSSNPVRGLNKPTCSDCNKTISYGSTRCKSCNTAHRTATASVTATRADIRKVARHFGVKTTTMSTAPVLCQAGAQGTGKRK